MLFEPKRIRSDNSYVPAQRPITVTASGLSSLRAEIQADIGKNKKMRAEGEKQAKLAYSD